MALELLLLQIKMIDGFVYGFEKNVVDNINSMALAGLQDLASDLLSLDDSQLNAAVQKEVIEEIGHD